MLIFLKRFQVTTNVSKLLFLLIRYLDDIYMIAMENHKNSTWNFVFGK
jgi:hypothetical protein